MLKVIVSIDGSGFSESIFETVKKLLLPHLHSLLLLEVAPIPEELEEVSQNAPTTWTNSVGYKTAWSDFRRTLEPDRSAYVERIWEVYEKDILASMEKPRSNLEIAGFKVETKVRFGDPALEISDVVKRENIDLIIMATHQRQGLSHLVFGSITEDTVNHSHIPVLAVPVNWHYNN